jgi:hypothetical protein
VTAARYLFVCVASTSHVAAIAPARNTDPVIVDRQGFDHLFYSGIDITKVSIAEVLDVSSREFLALTVASRGFGKNTK